MDYKQKADALSTMALYDHSEITQREHAEKIHSALLEAHRNGRVAGLLEAADICDDRRKRKGSVEAESCALKIRQAADRVKL